MTLDVKKNPAYGRHWISWPMRIVSTLPLNCCPIYIYIFPRWFFFLLSFLERGGGGREDQWEAWNWSCDLRANERPKKIHPLTQTDRQSDKHDNSMTESAQWGRFSENLTYARPWISRRLLIVALIPQKKLHNFFIRCHVSGVSCHVSHVMCHISCVTCHVSHFICHMSCVMCRSSTFTCHMSLTSKASARDPPPINVQVCIAGCCYWSWPRPNNDKSQRPKNSFLYVERCFIIYEPKLTWTFFEYCSLKKSFCYWLTFDLLSLIFFVTF